MDWVSDPISGLGLMSLIAGNNACIMKNVVAEPTTVIWVLLAPAGASATATLAPAPASTTAPARNPLLKIDPLYFMYFTFTPS